LLSSVIAEPPASTAPRCGRALEGSCGLAWESLEEDEEAGF
jgi:hypothetical protein